MLKAGAARVNAEEEAAAAVRPGEEAVASVKNLDEFYAKWMKNEFAEFHRVIGA